MKGQGATPEKTRLHPLRLLLPIGPHRKRAINGGVASVVMQRPVPLGVEQQRPTAVSLTSGRPVEQIHKRLNRCLPQTQRLIRGRQSFCLLPQPMPLPARNPPAALQANGKPQCPATQLIG